MRMEALLTYSVRIVRNPAGPCSFTTRSRALRYDSSRSHWVLEGSSRTEDGARSLWSHLEHVMMYADERSAEWTRPRPLGTILAVRKMSGTNNWAAIALMSALTASIAVGQEVPVNGTTETPPPAAAPAPEFSLEMFLDR